MRTRDRLRRLPPICLIVALWGLLAGRLRFPATFVGAGFPMEDGRRFTVFRHMSMTRRGSGEPGRVAVFIVRFRFARSSHRVNRLLSLIPVPLIAGFPGFHNKLWMVDPSTGDWQGIYEWDSLCAAKEYERSFVLRLMTRRAAEGTVTFRTVPETGLSDYLGRLRGARERPPEPRPVGGR